VPTEGSGAAEAATAPNMAPAAMSPIVAKRIGFIEFLRSIYARRLGNAGELLSEHRFRATKQGQIQPKTRKYTKM